MLDFHLEQLLDRFLDLRFAGVCVDFEAKRSFVLFEREPFFGNHGTLDDAVNSRHLVSTSCNASIAAFVNTTCFAFKTWYGVSCKFGSSWTSLKFRAASQML